MDRSANEAMPTDVVADLSSQHVMTGRTAQVMLLTVYTCAIFVGAFLIFLVQPMVAKMALPLFGGSPSVWNTSMVFFQILLLAGYGYAHFSTKRLGLHRQSKLHLVVLLLPLVVLPVQLRPDSAQPGGVSPVLWLLLILAVTAGLPYLVVSTASPILQRWFAGVDHPNAADPYFLYAASNAGSLLALLAYPIVVEPNLTLAQQGKLWMLLYLLFVSLCIVSVALLHRFPGSLTHPHLPDAATSEMQSLSWRQRLRWIALAFIPSSLMVGATGFLSTDVASAPFLWVVPLATYLLTFILAFAQKRLVSLDRASTVLPIVAVLGIVANPAFLPLPIALMIFIHIGVLFLVSFVAHGKLADDRPAARHLTEFYLLVSVGGVLGGVFNALIAPVVFDEVVEYSMVIVVSMLLAPLGGTEPVRPSDLLGRLTDRSTMVRLLVTAVVIGIMIVGTPDGFLRWCLIAALGTVVSLVAGASIVQMVSQGVQKRPAFYVGAAIAVLALPMFLAQPVLHAERTFFGVMQVRDIDGNRRILKHGTTIHGTQDFTSEATAREPLGYYSRSGPVGQVFSYLQQSTSLQSVGVIGLGTGAIAAYGVPGQEMTFYEIDPAVTRIASDPRYFTYLSDSAATIHTVDGDGRLAIEDVPQGTFDLLIVDAFSSDSIPMHLLTTEAFELYRDKLTPDGALLIHITNRNLDLEPVIGAIARNQGMPSLTRHDKVDREATDAGIYDSHWVVLGMSDSVLAGFASDERWHDVAVGSEVWTDEFSNIIRTLRWLK